MLLFYFEYIILIPSATNHMFVCWSNRQRASSCSRSRATDLSKTRALCSVNTGSKLSSKSSDSLTFSKSLSLIWGLKFDIEGKVNTKLNRLLPSGWRHERSPLTHIRGLHKSNGGHVLQGLQCTAFLLRKKLPKQKLSSSTPYHSLEQKK